MNDEQLLKFIFKAHKNTYAAPKKIKSKYMSEIPILGGHKDYDFVDGDWRYHDSYAGWRWAPGKEVIFYKNKPVWCMSYQGQIIGELDEKFIEETFEFLKNALRNIDDKMPFRGPSEFREGDFEYTFIMNGNYDYFTGRESIKHKGNEVFFQDIMGSLIK